MGERYPKQGAMFSGIEETHVRFEALREDFLLDYRHNTARAYWADLEDLLEWCIKRNISVLDMSDTQFEGYLEDMRQQGYSASTIRRRRTSFRGFRAHVDRNGTGRSSE